MLRDRGKRRMLGPRKLRKGGGAMAVAGVDRQRRPRVDVLATPIDRAIAFGCNAPNPHNTQAWKFRNTSELETVFYVDE
jgi:hypothetical protein